MSQIRLEQKAKPKKPKKKSLRKQLRDTQRLLARQDLPLTISQEKTRVLALLEQQVEQRKEERSKHRNKFDNKYKMVLFFERRKIQRRLNSVLRELASSQETTSVEEQEGVLDQVQQLRADLNYVLHFPPSEERYYSLYPSTPSAETKTVERRAIIYQQILENIKEGVLKDMSLEQPYCGGHLELIQTRLPIIDTSRLPSNHSTTDIVYKDTKKMKESVDRQKGRETRVSDEKRLKRSKQKKKHSEAHTRVTEQTIPKKSSHHCCSTEEGGLPFIEKDSFFV